MKTHQTSPHPGRLLLALLALLGLVFCLQSALKDMSKSGKYQGGNAAVGKQTTELYHLFHSRQV